MSDLGRCKHDCCITRSSVRAISRFRCESRKLGTCGQLEGNSDLDGIQCPPLGPESESHVELFSVVLLPVYSRRIQDLPILSEHSDTSLQRSTFYLVLLISTLLSLLRSSNVTVLIESSRFVPEHQHHTNSAYLFPDFRPPG
jgi:hypothetical protein